MVGIRPGLAVVDLCCGDGHFTLPLARIARRVYAIDIDPQMLDRARELLVQEGVENCEFIQADAMDLPAVVPMAVDYVFMANTFHGVPDKQGLAQVVASILGRRGEFVVVNWHRRAREETVVLGQPRGPKTEMRMEAADVAAAVGPAGLSLRRVVELPAYHYGAVFHRSPG
ncbi:MAG: class SAM-dependent methyltransferase [Rhodospirillales bacterium]|nr:class SAM-dependent methyltransferase [Rhodospirillales bacterium]